MSTRSVYNFKRRSCANKTIVIKLRNIFEKGDKVTLARTGIGASVLLFKCICSICIGR